MYNPNLNDQTNENVFILDRNQLAQPSQRPGTPTPNYNIITPPRTTITYDIVKTADLHVVLIHEQPPIDTTNVENEQGTIGQFTQDNPVIPDGRCFSEPY